MNNKYILAITVLVLAQIFWVSRAFAQAITADASATGISRAFNPALSVNGLFSGMGTTRDSEDGILWEEQGVEPGLHLQEMSLEVSSNVDIYFKAQAALTVTETEDMYMEEMYLTTLRMPIPVMIRGGRMLNTFGRHNLYHAHHFAFAEPPMILQQVFGPDLNETSIEVSYLVPLPWYTDILAGVLNGDNPYLFEGDEHDDFAYLAHLDNLWDLTDSTALRLGASYLAGEKGLHYADGTPIPEELEVEEIISDVWGVDLHLKWKPLQYGRSRSLIFQGEYMEARLNIDDDITDPLHGYFAQAMGQFALKYWLQARYDWFSRPEELHMFFPEPVNLEYDFEDELQGDRISVALAYVPTEFSAFRIQYNIINLGEETEYQTVAQVNITVGSHPAHKY